MKLNINQNCDFCRTTSLEMVYEPINSARGMKVFICDNCGLFQSISTKSYQSRPPGSMSADADRSSYRYTKDIVTGRYQDCFHRFIDFGCIKKILDIGSNRGAFIKYLSEFAPNRKITAIEPDSNIISGYDSLPNVSVNVTRFENTKIKEHFYDFAYCVHTLEHASSASQMLLKIHRALLPNRQLFLVVPNLIFYKDIIEELFIDPHIFHFSHRVLTDFIKKNGFSIQYSSGSNEPEIILCLQKKKNMSRHRIYRPSFGKSIAHISKKKLKEYKKNILKNRIDIKKEAFRLNALGAKYKLVIWGAGRIFDGLVRFGKLSVSKVYVIVDKFLYKYETRCHGIRLSSPDVLKNKQKRGIIIYVASRDYAQEISKEANEMGFKKVIIFGKKK